MSQMMQPNIILLRDGTDTSSGIGQTISNINACEAIGSVIKSTLGPCGMDKLVYQGDVVNISNDGATIMRLLDIVHPAAQTLVSIARSQDEEVGDGTTSVVVLACSMLSAAKEFIEEGMHPQVIINGFRIAGEMAKEKIRELAVDMSDKSTTRETLIRCGSTALNSKLISSQGEFFATMVVDACMHLEGELDLDLIGIKKEVGGSLTDSQFIEGVAFKKTFSYAGFEQQPKYIENPKVLLLNIELELKQEATNIEVRITDPSKFKEFVDAEWNIIYSKMENIVATGANVILSRLAIGDLATQYFAERGIFCAGRVQGEDLTRVAKATGAKVQTTVNNISNSVLGECGLFEEKRIGGERYNVFTGCPNTKTATILLRGGGQQFIDESARSLHDSIMVVRRAMKYTNIVAGGGAVEMEVAKHLSDYAKTVPGKLQNIIKAYAKAFEQIPQQLSINAGLDPIEIMAQLRKKHHEGDIWAGVDLINDGVVNTFETFVWEPTIIKLNSIEAATEAACLILSVDRQVKNPKANHKLPQQ